MEGFYFGEAVFFGLEGEEHSFAVFALGEEHCVAGFALGGKECSFAVFFALGGKECSFTVFFDCFLL